ncbi:poly(ADP-ribose) glycohydrolase 1-like [Impatiens glandulifera]|uniref:poly(ADP-ribose) glycohydrolase 1-like n=1 Tax=Impatiens glandulifera TaxID=253017 RepID=UPI001FB07E61|nr:poly(ADP-ribose) glycohydrolase 1-like [Impatiens glandulifera]
MKNRDDLISILPYLPLSLSSSSGLFWPPQIVEILKTLSLGPGQSGVTSGYILFQAISSLRRSISHIFTYDKLATSSSDGYALFFDNLISREESRKWLGHVIPSMSNLLLRLPSLLEAHYHYSDILSAITRDQAITGLRLIESQMSGIVFLGQELIGAFLVCSFFCLFPIADRDEKNLPTINFDQMFASVCGSNKENMEHKVRCIMNYFERLYNSMPTGTVSFERKVLSLESSPRNVCYPKVDDWSNSLLPLCQFEAYNLGLIEDQARGAMEVDFSGQYFGGAALHTGSLQEEIRFMINPELIVGMLFFTAMNHNEAIEVVGAERFSDYTGFGFTFRFYGDYIDRRGMDLMGRRKTRIIAIDALCMPRMKQYCLGYLLREVNKALCGFQEGFKFQQQHQQNTADIPSTSRVQRDKGKAKASCLENVESISEGIATGNWGCGAFEGDPELKVVIQWLAASQAKRPFILYYTFGLDKLKNIEKICERIIANGWTVGKLWEVVVEYSSKRLDGRILDGFFTWFFTPPPTF